MLPIINNIAREYKAALKKVYGNGFAGLILFGSHARGDFKEESDIDFAIILTDPLIQPATEIFKTAPISNELCLKYGVSISTLPVSSQKLKTSIQGVYQEIRREGIMI